MTDVPGDRPATEPVDRSAPFDDAALGLLALAGTQDGIAVVGPDGAYVYANPAACQLLGRPLEQVLGHDFLDSFPAREHASVSGHLADRSADALAPFSCVMLGADGTELEIVCSVYSINLPGGSGWGAVFRDLTGPRVARRTAVALAQSAALLVANGTDTDEILSGLARHAVEATRALACGIVAFADDHIQTLAAGGYGPWGAEVGETRGSGYNALADIPGEQLVEAFSAGSIVLGAAPGRPVVLIDAVRVWGDDPLLRDFVATEMVQNWRGGIVCVPLSWQSRVFGFVSVYLPASTAGPSEEELAFYTALTDQAAVAVTNARLAAEARVAVAAIERSRLARELHDSVSQALFSMTMHARAAQLSMVKSGLDQAEPLGRSIAYLAELTQGALAEMRALIFELREGALAEEGLIAALTKKGAALSAQERLTVTVHGPEQRLGIDPASEEHLYRIATEALHNAVKHAEADAVTVVVTVDERGLQLTVADDGRGFDVEQANPGHLGLAGMSERAAAIDAHLAVTSSVTGTAVTISLANAALDRAAGK